MRRSFLRAVLGAALSAIATAHAVAGDAEAVTPVAALRAVEARMQADVAGGKLPSVAFALIRDGRIVREGGVGMADREHDVAATAHTPYPLASVTKPLVATAVMRLGERGRLELDQPAARYLPDAAQGVPGTVRQLLAHTSGLTTYVRIAWADKPGAGPVGEPWPYAFAAQPPGTLFEYSNLGYGVLGRLVEARSGKRLGEFLRSDVFEPLGMRDASMPDGFEVPKGAARKIGPDGQPLAATSNDTPGAGNAWASAHDLALFAAFHLSSAPSAVLTADDRHRMRSQVEPDARHDYYGGARYGLGWFFRAEPSGERVVWHEGGMPGASAIVYMLPERGLAAVVLINQTDANEAAQGFAQALVHAVAPDFNAAPLVATQGFERYAGGADLRGRWTGDVVIDGHPRPWTLSFGADGQSTVEFPGEPDTAAGHASLHALVHDGMVLGGFEGSLPAPGLSPGAGRYVLLRLVRHDDQITGALVAFSSEARLEYLVPYPVSLRRQPD